MSAVKLPSTITLRSSFGCCGSDVDQLCECWCHDPSQGGTNLYDSDTRRAEVKAVLDWMVSSTGTRPFTGTVIWSEDEVQA